MNFETLLKKAGIALGLLLLFLWQIATDALYSLWDSLTKRGTFENNLGKETDIGNRFNKGIVYSINRRLNKKTSYANVLLVGPSGSGKSQRIIIKNLVALKNCSLIVNDPSMELYYATSAYLQQYFKILTLNFSSSKISCGYNILSRIKRPNDINKIADMLTRGTLGKGGGEMFWILQTKALLTAFITLVVYQPEQYRNMANVLHLLNLFATDPKKVDALVVKTKDNKLLLAYKTFVVMPPKTLQSIIASASAALNLFSDPEIARVTAYDSFSIQNLRDQPTVLFLHNSVSDQAYINTLNGIVFTQLFGEILNKLPEKHHLDLHFILDEASSLFIDGYATYLANTRKARVSNLICTQSIGQLRTLYGDESKNIVANTWTKIFLAGNTDIETLKEIELLAGKTITKGANGSERVTSLISVDAIRQLPKNRTLILSGNNPIIKGRTSPYYKSFTYRKYRLLPPLELLGDIPDAPIPFLCEESTEMDTNDENS